MREVSRVAVKALSYVKGLFVFYNVAVRVPSCIYWHVWQLCRDGNFDIALGVVVVSFSIWSAPGIP